MNTPSIDEFGRTVLTTDLYDIKIVEQDPTERRPSYVHVDYDIVDVSGDTPESKASAVKVAHSVLPELAGRVVGDLDNAARGAFFYWGAGCDCNCSPGVVLGSPLMVDGHKVDIFVSPAS